MSRLGMRMEWRRVRGGGWVKRRFGVFGVLLLFLWVVNGGLGGT